MSKVGEYNKPAKLVICEHYEEQIREIDIYAESVLEKLGESNTSAVLSMLDEHKAGVATEFYGLDKRCIKKEPDADDDDEDDDENEAYKFHEPYSHKFTYSDDSVATSPVVAGNVGEYVAKCRTRQIDEIQRLLDENIKYYESIRNELNNKSSQDVNQLTPEQRYQKMRAALFDRKFCLALNLSRMKHMEYGCFGCQSVFSIYLFVLDFYLSPDDIQLLKLDFI